MKARSKSGEFSLLGSPLYRLGRRLHLFRGVTSRVSENSMNGTTTGKVESTTSKNTPLGTSIVVSIEVPANRWLGQRNESLSNVLQEIGAEYDAA